MSRRAVSFLCVLALANSVAATLILPILPELMVMMGAENTAAAARMGGFVVFAFVGMQIALAPAFGELADTIGRRPILIAALLLTAISHGFVVLTDNFATLVAARTIGGLGAATGIAVSSMIADIAPAQDRARLFGRIAAAGGAGAIIGPAIGGLLGVFGAKAPFMFAALAQVVLLTAALTILPETLSSDNRRKVLISNFNPFVGFTSIVQTSPPSLFLVLVLGHLGFAAIPVLWPYFTGVQYGWGPGMVGVSLALAAAASILAQTLLLPLARRHVCDRLMVALTLTSGTGLMVVLGAVYSSSFALIALALIAAGGIGLSILMGLISSGVSSTDQGRLMGATSALSGTAGLIAPLAFPAVFAFAVERNIGLAGMPFLVAAMVTGCAGAVSWSYWARKTRSEPID